jgi:hypothetical protein
VWQLDGQWNSVRFQESADPGSVPSCTSVGEPAKLMMSPTFQVVPAAGAVMLTVGGADPGAVCG